MILVTVGLSHFGFDRLIKEMDNISTKIDEKIIIQSGSSLYQPIYAESFTFTDREHMNQLYNDCRVIVTHAGAGSIISSIKRKIKPLVVPRLKVYKEVFDDHQVEIANELSKQGLVIKIDDLMDIQEYLMMKNQYKLELDPSENPKSDLISNLKNYIKSIDE